MKHEPNNDEAACIHGYRGAYECNLVAYVVLVDKILIDGVDEAQQQYDLDD